MVKQYQDARTSRRSGKGRSRSSSSVGEHEEDMGSRTSPPPSHLSHQEEEDKMVDGEEEEGEKEMRGLQEMEEEDQLKHEILEETIKFNQDVTYHTFFDEFFGNSGRSLINI